MSITNLITPDFTEKAETRFRYGFASTALLYGAASKVKIPYETRKDSASLYRGSLKEEVRTVELLADYRTFDKIANGTPTVDDLLTQMTLFGQEAGAAVDTLIRIENVRNNESNDPRNTKDLKVANVFEFADGHPNLEIIAVENPGFHISDPSAELPGWLAYRFYFACAAIKLEYKK